MAQMGFTSDPGSLPFITIRDVKWANRLVDLPMPLRIHGENGCGMPMQIATVVRVEPYAGPSNYPLGTPLVKVWLVKPCPCKGPHAWDQEIQMCAHCGATIEDAVNEGELC